MSRSQTIFWFRPVPVVQGGVRETMGGGGGRVGRAHTHIITGILRGAGDEAFFSRMELFAPLSSTTPPPLLATAEQHTTITAVPSSHRGGALYHHKGAADNRIARGFEDFLFYFVMGGWGGGSEANFAVFGATAVICAILLPKRLLPS